MAGTRAGGLRAAAKNIENDPNFYARIGAIGGKNSNTGGFAARTECHCDALPHRHHKAQCAGKKGGAISRKHKKVL